MSPIEQAIEKLGTAVERLEAAGRVRLDTLREQSHQLADQSQRGERLAAQLAQVRSDYDTLHLTSSQASGRIDVAIGRLRSLLET